MVVMWTHIIAFVLGVWFGFTMVAFLNMARDDGDK